MTGFFIMNIFQLNWDIGIGKITLGGFYVMTRSTNIVKTLKF